MGKRIDKKPMIEYLEIDENTFIEKDIVKTRLNESNDYVNFISHEELWTKIYDNMLIIREYDEKHNKNKI